MAIKKDIAHQKPPTERGDLCWRTFSRNLHSVLRIELQSGRTFLLPYAHWIHGDLERFGGIEQLTINFSSHELRIEGENLRDLLPELQARNVELLREVPEQAQRLTNGAVIRAIAVNGTARHSEMPVGSSRPSSPSFVSQPNVS